MDKSGLQESPVANLDRFEFITRGVHPIVTLEPMPQATRPSRHVQTQLGTNPAGTLFTRFAHSTHTKPTTAHQATLSVAFFLSL